MNCTRYRTSEALETSCWRMTELSIETERVAWFTPDSLASYLQVSDRMIRKWVAEGRLRSYKLDGCRRFDPTDVDCLRRPVPRRAPGGRRMSRAAPRGRPPAPGSLQAHLPGRPRRLDRPLPRPRRSHGRYAKPRWNGGKLDLRAQRRRAGGDRRGARAPPRQRSSSPRADRRLLRPLAAAPPALRAHQQDQPRSHRLRARRRDRRSAAARLGVRRTAPPPGACSGRPHAARRRSRGPGRARTSSARSRRWPRTRSATTSPRPTPSSGLRLRRSDPRIKKPPRKVRVWSFEQMREFATGGRPEVRAANRAPARPARQAAQREAQAPLLFRPRLRGAAAHTGPDRSAARRVPRPAPLRLRRLARSASASPPTKASWSNPASRRTTSAPCRCRRPSPR